MRKANIRKCDVNGYKYYVEIINDNVSIYGMYCETTFDVLDILRYFKLL